MLDLDQLTGELEQRREALPIEFALHIAIASMRATIDGNRELGPLRAVRLRDVVIDPRGRVLVRLHRGVCSEDELVRSYAVLSFAMLAGERPEGRAGTPIRLLAEEDVPPSIIRIVARATSHLHSQRHRSLEDLHGDFSHWMAVHRKRVTPAMLIELLRRNRLLDRARPLQNRRTSHAGWWFSASI